MIATTVFALVGAAPILPAPGLGQLPPQRPAPIAPILPSLSRSGKFAAAKSQLKLNALPRGIVETTVLSVRNAFIEGKGHLRFYNCTDVEAGRLGTGSAQLSPSDGYCFISPILRFARLNKVHTITYYFKSSAAQEVLLHGHLYPSAKVNIKAGVQAIPYAFIPTREGPSEFALFASTADITFYKAEIDVMD
jgi:hypothetical protein